MRPLFFRYRLLFWAMTLLAAPAFAQPQAPDTLWTRTFGGHGWDYAESVVSTADGGCAVVGYASDDTVPSHAFILRLSGQGDSLWCRRYGSPEITAHAICLATDGGFIFGGEMLDSGLVVGYLSKVDEEGTQVWRQTYEGGWDLDIRGVRPTADGGHIVGARGPGLSMSLLRTDSHGQEIWRCPFYAGTPFWLSGVGELADGSFFLAGTCDGPPPTYPSVFFLAKASATGDSVWMHTYWPEDDAWSYGMTITSDGGALLCGHIERDLNHHNIYLVRANNDGDTVWTRTFFNTGSATAHDAMELSDGGFVVCGRTNSHGAQESDYFLLKLSAAGDSLWMRLYGTSGVEQAPRLAGSAETGFILAGWTLVPGRRWDIYVVKTAPLLPVDPPPAEIVHRFQLYPAYPNPFNSACTIAYSLPRTGDVQFGVYDVTGRLVQRTVLGWQYAGEHVWTLSGIGLSSGTYFVRLSTGGFPIQARKVLLVK